MENTRVVINTQSATGDKRTDIEVNVPMGGTTAITLTRMSTSEVTVRVQWEDSVRAPIPITESNESSFQSFIQPLIAHDSSSSSDSSSSNFFQSPVAVVPSVASLRHTQSRLDIHQILRRSSYSSLRGVSSEPQPRQPLFPRRTRATARTSTQAIFPGEWEALASGSGTAEQSLLRASASLNRSCPPLQRTETEIIDLESSPSQIEVHQMLMKNLSEAD